MQFRSVLTAAVFAAAVGISFASAQQNVAEEREQLMKENNRNAILISKMVKGELPYDAQKVGKAFDQWDDTAKKLPKLFPETAKTGGDNRALPTIWTNRAEFDKDIAQFAKDVAAQRAKATENLAGLKTAWPMILDDCNDCHKEFRRRSVR
jgi:cytochrome c556